MTTKDAILKLADAVSGNTSANVATDVQALAVLAQAMTGGVPAEPLATVDDAIGYIADNYSGGGGGGDTTDFWLWNFSESSDAKSLTIGVSRAVGINEDNYHFTTEPCEVEQVTAEDEGATIHGVHVTNVPVGSPIVCVPQTGYSVEYMALSFSVESYPTDEIGAFDSVPNPIDGYVISGYFTLESNV